MPGTLGNVIGRVRSLVGDPDGDFTTEAYLLPLIAQVYDQQINTLEQTSAPILVRVVTLSAVPAGTRDLLAYQAAQMDDGTGTGSTIPGPLAGIELVFSVEFKQAGTPESNYQPATGRRVLPDVPYAGGTPSLGLNLSMAYEWRDFGLYVTPLSFAADLRIRGEVDPGTLLRGSDLVLVPRMVAALAYGTAALIGIDRNNATWKEDYGSLAASSLDDVANQLVRSGQGDTCRLGRITGRRR